MTYRLLISSAAEEDIVSILRWSADHFGEAARQRYERLIGLALQQLANDPFALGSRERSEIGSGVRSWHLLSSRPQLPASEVVRSPRHFLVYRVESDAVVLGRVLHDSMDIGAHGVE